MTALFAFPDVLIGKFLCMNLKIEMQIIVAIFREKYRSARITLVIGLGGLIIAPPSWVLDYIDPENSSRGCPSAVGSIIAELAVKYAYWEKLKSFFEIPEGEFMDSRSGGRAKNKNGKKI